jgi:putative flippase GtrA
MTALGNEETRGHRKLIAVVQKFITHVIDFFYPPFRKFMPLSLFRYGFSGASNVLLDWTLFFTAYNFVFQKQLLNLGFVVITPHIASLMVSFPITFFTGFFLSKYVSFSGSPLRGKVQLVRYIIVVACCLLINYVCLKLFVETLKMWPLPSKMVTTVFATLFSYFSQKHYTFKTHKIKHS